MAESAAPPPAPDDASGPADPESLPETLDPGLRIIVARSLGDPDRVRDAVQEILARTIEAVREGRVPPGLPLNAFVYGITRHVIADALRARAREGPRGGDVRQLPSSRPSAVEMLVRKEEVAALRNALRELSAEDRRLLDRFYRDGVRIVELAAELGVPPARLRKRKSRALRKLREILTRGGSGGDGAAPPSA